MMKQTIKQRQVAAMIQKEFSVVLQKEGNLIYGDALVTVTRVRLSADMGIAYIYLSVYNTLYKQEIIKELWENLSRLRGELGNRIKKNVRRIPMLKFFIDDTLDEVEHLDMLFQNIYNQDAGEMSMKEAMEMRAAIDDKVSDDEDAVDEDFSDEEE
jgi:ribosome-binding factor A